MPSLPYGEVNITNTELAEPFNLVDVFIRPISYIPNLITLLWLASIILIVCGLIQLALYVRMEPKDYHTYQRRRDS